MRYADRDAGRKLGCAVRFVGADAEFFLICQYDRLLELLRAGEHELDRGEVLFRGFAQVEVQEGGCAEYHRYFILTDDFDHLPRIEGIGVVGYFYVAKHRVPYGAHNAEGMEERQRAADAVFRGGGEHHLEAFDHGEHVMLAQHHAFWLPG